MAIELTCPGCGKRLRVPDSAAGKKGKCPSCGMVVDIPLPLEEVSEEKQKPRQKVRQKATTVRRPAAKTRRPSSRTSSKLPSKLQRRSATSKLTGKGGGRVKARVREYDPEAAAKRKKRQLIFLLIIGVVIIAGLITTQILYFGPMKRRYMTWRRAMEATDAYLARFTKDVLDNIPVSSLPEESTQLKRIVDRAKRLLQKYKKNIEDAGVKDVVDKIIKKSRLYKYCIELPKLTANILSTLDSILTEKQDYFDEGRKEEWEKNKPEIFKRYLTAYTDLEKRYVVACYLHDAWIKSVFEPHWVEKDWTEWTEKWIGRYIEGEDSLIVSFGG